MESNNIDECHFSSINSCQSSGSGGHPHTIFSTLDGNCAKKIRSQYTLKELDFYLKIQEICERSDKKISNFCNFLPRFKGVCKDKKNLYIKIQNLKNEDLNHIKSLDLKIGRYTLSRNSLLKSHTPYASIYFWLGVHVFQDRFTTSSMRKGYRFAGQTSQGVKEKEIRKVSYYFFPGKSIRSFLGKDGKTYHRHCFHQKLQEFDKIINSSGFERFHLVGSSLLFVYNTNKSDPARGCSMNLIDFANSYIIDKKNMKDLKKNKKYVESFRSGVRNLKNYFKDLL